MNISGITPWYFNNGQKRDYPQKRGNMREAFDSELNKYLDRTSKEPFRECECCGHNIFDYDEAFEVAGAYYCWDCVHKVKAVDTVIEPTEYIEPPTY